MMATIEPERGSRNDKAPTPDTSPYTTDRPPFSDDLPGSVLAFAGLTVRGWRVFAKAADQFRPIRTWGDVADAVVEMLGSDGWAEAPSRKDVVRILEYRGLHPDAPVWPEPRLQA